MVWFQCDDCGESLKKPSLPRHFNICSATKLSCIDCGTTFGQDSVQWHTQCITEAEKYGPKETSDGTHASPKDIFKQQLDFEYHPSWICSLCNAKANCEQNFFAHVRGRKHREKAKGFDAEQRKQFEQPIVCKNDYDINVGLSNQYPWLCSLCNVKASCQQNLLTHAKGKKHRENVEWSNANQQQQQSEQLTVDKENSKYHPDFDINFGLSNSYPWFCSLCNMKATSQQTLLSHANGKTHRSNIECLNANQLQESEKSMMDKKNTFENAYPGTSEQKKVDWHAPSFVANGYSQSEKKRKREAFSETWNEEVVQAEDVRGEGEKKSELKKAKKHNHEKKQTESDTEFEYDKEDVNLLLLSYSKDELVNLIYKTAEKGSRLVLTILESADRDISQRNIFVRGFGWDTTRECLKAAFESYGEIEECSVVMDKDTGRSKGYGFVLFKTWKGAREALKSPEKRMYNHIVLCYLASAKPSRIGKMHDIVEPVKIDITQREAALPRLRLAQGHVHEQRPQQQTMDMLGQNIPFYRYSRPPGFDPVYGAVRGNQMVGGLPNYCMLGSGLMNQGSRLPQSHVGMAGQYLGDGEYAWHPR